MTKLGFYLTISALIYFVICTDDKPYQSQLQEEQTKFYTKKHILLNKRQFYKNSKVPFKWGKRSNLQFFQMTSTHACVEFITILISKKQINSQEIDISSYFEDCIFLAKNILDSDKRINKLSNNRKINNYDGDK